MSLLQFNRYIIKYILDVTHDNLDRICFVMCCKQWWLARESLVSSLHNNIKSNRKFFQQLSIFYGLKSIKMKSFKKIARDLVFEDGIYTLKISRTINDTKQDINQIMNQLDIGDNINSNSDSDNNSNSNNMKYQPKGDEEDNGVIVNTNPRSILKARIMYHNQNKQYAYNNLIIEPNGKTYTKIIARNVIIGRSDEKKVIPQIEEGVESVTTVGEISEPITIGTFPNTVKRIAIMSYSAGPLTEGILPSSLVELELNGSIPNMIGMTLPNTLTKLVLRGRPLNEHARIELGQLSNLKILKLNGYFKFDTLPDSITSLVIMNNDSHSVLQFPPNLLHLQLYVNPNTGQQPRHLVLPPKLQSFILCGLHSFKNYLIDYSDLTYNTLIKLKIIDLLYSETSTFPTEISPALLYGIPDTVESLSIHGRIGGPFKLPSSLIYLTVPSTINTCQDVSNAISTLGFQLPPTLCGIGFLSNTKDKTGLMSNLVSWIKSSLYSPPIPPNLEKITTFDEIEDHIPKSIHHWDLTRDQSNSRLHHIPKQIDHLELTFDHFQFIWPDWVCLVCAQCNEGPCLDLYYLINLKHLTLNIKLPLGFGTKSKVQLSIRCFYGPGDNSEPISILVIPTNGFLLGGFIPYVKGHNLFYYLKNWLIVLYFYFKKTYVWSYRLLHSQ